MPLSDEPELDDWARAIRGRPEMYMGESPALRLEYLIRGLLDCGYGTVSAHLERVERTFLIALACTPPSIASDARSGRPFLQEACMRITMPVDTPPTLSMTEAFDGSPPRFYWVNQVTPVLTFANAVSSEFEAISRMSGIAHRFAFSRGRVTCVDTLPASGGDGLTIRMTPDPRLFEDDDLLDTSNLARLARDIASVRGFEVTLRDPKTGERCRLGRAG